MPCTTHSTPSSLPQWPRRPQRATQPVPPYVFPVCIHLYPQPAARLPPTPTSHQVLFGTHPWPKITRLRIGGTLSRRASPSKRAYDKHVNHDLLGRQRKPVQLGQQTVLGFLEHYV